MDYTVNINGKTYELPPKTLEMDERLEKISHLQARRRSGEISVREMVEAEYSFVIDCTGVELPPLLEVDTGELEIAVMRISDSYRAPAFQERIEQMSRTLRSAVDRPEVDKLLAATDQKRKRR